MSDRVLHAARVLAMAARARHLLDYEHEQQVEEAKNNY
jgi:hypothetical protein